MDTWNTFWICLTTLAAVCVVCVTVSGWHIRKLDNEDEGRKDPEADLNHKEEMARLEQTFLREMAERGYIQVSVLKQEVREVRPTSMGPYTEEQKFFELAWVHKETGEPTPASP